MNYAKLRRLLASVRLVKGEDGELLDILPYPFCPLCGCTATWSVDHFAPFPERWVDVYCARCGHLVECSDNSPFRHCLEFEERGYQIR